MRAVSEECSLQPVTIAMAYVYFEKLVLQGRLNKPNRKLVSAVCVLLAAKISSDLKKLEVKQLIDVSGFWSNQKCSDRLYTVSFWLDIKSCDFDLLIISKLHLFLHMPLFIYKTLVFTLLLLDHLLDYVHMHDSYYSLLK